MKSSILWQFTKRSLAKNRTRTVVSIIGVVLSTALICGVFTTVSSVHGALLNRLVAFEGSWHAMSSDVKHETVKKLIATQQVHTAASSTEVARVTFAAKGPNDEAFENFTIRTLPQVLKGSPQEARKLTTQPSMTQGAFPTAKNQIALPETCRNTRFTDSNVYSDEKLDVGSVIHLKVNGKIQNWVVSGFYDAMNRFYGNSLVAHDTNGYLALAAADAASYTNSNRGMVWYRLAGFSHQDGLASHVENTLGVKRGQNESLEAKGGSEGNAGTGSEAATDSSTTAKPKQFVIFHQNLMRDEGLRGRSSNWDALWNMGIFLAIIISVASIALIYNSFSISVAERKKQFGLLASLGASKAQIRRMVYLETLSIAVIGIPVGIICGIAGVAGTLWLARDGFSVIFGKTGMISLAINPVALITTVGFELLVLFMSATIPALRASRVSPIAAIRQAQDIKIGRRLSKKLMRLTKRGAASGAGNTATTAAGNTDATPRLSLSERLFGTEGMLSTRNLSRASSRGRTITASLAVSVTLIVITGVIAQIFLPYAFAKNEMIGPDILVRVNGDGRYDPEELARTLDKAAAQIPGLKTAKTTRRTTATLVLQKDALTETMRNYLMRQYTTQPGKPSEQTLLQGVTVKSDGSRVKDTYSSFAATSQQWSAIYNVVVPSQESWEKLAAAYGVDRDTGMLLFNKQRVDAQLMGNDAAGTDTAGSYDTNPIKTKTIKPFTNAKVLAGAATLIGRKNGSEPYGMPLFANFDSAGELVVFDDAANAAEKSGTGKKTDKQETYIPLSSIEQQLVRLPLKSAALLEKSPTEAPYMFSSSFSSDNFMIMSPALYKRYVSYFDKPSINYMFTMQGGAAQTTQSAAKATEQLRETLKRQGFASNTFDIHDFSTARRNDLLVAQTLLLFMSLFAGIMLLISMSNVFNTLCNSMILRTSEFAILRSVGMSEKQFRLMIFYECARYALRGLAWGSLISMGAYWLFWKNVIMRFDSAIVGERMAFSIPWISFISAGVCVMVVLAISVLYALHKTKARNIVEVLRNEAI